MNHHIEQRRKRRAELEQSAAKTLAQHVYTPLAVNTDCQVWRCARPGSSAYAFDIMMTRYGISIVGDIDGLTFSVGLGYGMQFLAGDDVDYYIHSKLEQNCKERELNEDQLREYVLCGIAKLICDHVSDEEWETLPDWLKEDDQRTADKWDNLEAFLDEKTGKGGPDDEWDEWAYLVAEVAALDHLDEAERYVADYHEQLGLGDDWWELSIDRPAHNLMSRLYMVRHAARQILQQQEEAA